MAGSIIDKEVVDTITRDRRTRGLTLGKFAPLHKGHQFLIETALHSVDDLMVMVYDAPDLPGMPPLPVRARWLREIYPAVEVIEARNGPTVVGLTPEIKRMHEEYILKTLDGERVTHFFSSEPYGEHVSAALGAQNVVVDLARGTVPVSGTRIREDVFANRAFIDPRVYRDLIVNVVFLGGPSTGKSTLAAALAKEYSTQWMPEYGREYWDTHHVDRRLSRQQMVEIAEGHIAREERLLRESNKYLFTDTNAITTYLFGLHYHGKAEKRLEELAVSCASRYDLFFVCENDIPYEDTWDRSGDANREEMQKRTIAYLSEHKIPYIALSGTLDARIGKVKRALDGFVKYQNLMTLNMLDK